MDDTLDKTAGRLVALNNEMGNSIPISDKVAILQVAALADISRALSELEMTMRRGA